MEDKPWSIKNAGYFLRRFNVSTEGKVFKESHGDSCGICGRSDKRLCTDHDHQTGQVRGRICSDCNSGLGLLSERLKEALEYIEKSKASTIFLSNFPAKTRQELNNIARDTLTRPDVIQKRNETQRSDEARLKKSESLKAAWSDPEIREKRIAALKKSWTPEARAKLGLAVSNAKKVKAKING